MRESKEFDKNLSDLEEALGKNDEKRTVGNYAREPIDLGDKIFFWSALVFLLTLAVLAGCAILSLILF